jgi:hypothetical protein
VTTVACSALVVGNIRCHSEDMFIVWTCHQCGGFPSGRICCVTVLAFNRNVSWAANVGIGKIAVAETVAKKCRLFMRCLMLAKSGLLSKQQSFPVLQG